MLKLGLYLGLTVFGLIAALFSPLAGAVAVVEAYLLNPAALSIDGGAVHYQLWLTIAFVIGLLINRRSPVPAAGREGWVLKALWIYLAIATASAAWAVISSQMALNGVYEIAKTILVATIIITVIRDERDFRILMMACLIGLLHAGILDTFGVRLGYVEASLRRESGILPDAECAVYILFVPTFLLLAMFGTRKERIFSWCALPFILNGLVGTYQRAAFVALVLQALLLLLLLPRRITLRLAPLLIAAACLFVFRLTPQNYWNRIATLEAPTHEASAESRIVVAHASLAMFADHPFGVGYSNYGDVSPRYLPEGLLTEGRRTAHSTFFTVLCETGFLGFSAWAASFGGAIYLLRRVRKSSDPSNLSRIQLYAMALELGLYGWFITGLFQGNQETDPAYWFLTFAVIITRLQRVADDADSVQAQMETQPATLAT